MNSIRILRLSLSTILALLALALVTGCDGDTSDDNNVTVSFPTEFIGTWLLQVRADQIGASAFSGTLNTNATQLLIRQDATWRHTQVEGSTTYIESGHSRWIAPSTLVIYWDSVSAGSNTQVGDSMSVTAYYTNEVLVLGVKDDNNASYTDWEMYVKQGLSTGVVAGICVNTTQTTLADVVVSAALPNSSGVRDTTNAYGFFYFSGLTNGSYTITGTYGTDIETRTAQIAPGVISPMILTFTGSAPTTGSIAGRVFNANDSTALSGVTISPDAGTADTTSATGDYTITGLTSGMHFFTITKSGYLESNAAVFITASQTISQNFFLAPTASGPGTVTGEVRNAVTGNPVVGATVAAENGQQTTTNANGEYTLSVSAGTRAVAASMTGFYTSNATLIRVVTGQTYTQNFTLAPQFTGGQGRMRLVLRWGTTPYDLDSHLLTPGGGHVYYGNDGDSTASPFALLDVDDTSGEGPETITIYQFSTGTYKYYINNFSGEHSGDVDITLSNAVVQIYGSSGLIQQLAVPTAPAGRFNWYICDIDGATQAITVRNTLQATPPTDANGKMPLMMAKKY